MTEKLRRDEHPAFPELFLDPRVVDALRGEISEPIQTISHKPGQEGKRVEIRLVKEGAGHFGLTDWQDNKEWAGIFNHVLISTRYSVHLAQKMAQASQVVNPQKILNGMIVSHAGRRQWDEAGWYPEAVKDAQKKRSISNETLGMQLIQGKVPQEAFELVVALGHNVEGFSVDPSIYNSWDFKLAIYVDHRTTQKYEPLNTRMGDFLLGNFFKRGEVTPEVKERVYTAVGNVIEKEKDYRLGKVGTEPVSLDEADQVAEQVGANPNSERLTRRELMRLILQDADTEAALIQAGIDPDNMSDETAPMPKWEDELRRKYVEAAKDSIIKRLDTHYEDLPLTIGSELVAVDPFVLDQIQSEFPQNTWWGQHARQLFNSFYSSF